MSDTYCATCGHRRGNHDGPCTIRFGRPSEMNLCPCLRFVPADTEENDRG